MAWTFTRLGMLGYPQYLGNVDEVTCPRFLFVCNEITINNLKQYDYEKTITIIRYDFATDGGKCRCKWYMWR